ncbi:N-acetyltransferase [Deinococcus sonorensis]|uniref:N-acetyltransferase n=2 Tax=Deinococcus sonorensis TaxID=309891 RepID=A0AAU7UBC1_9DEIO
MADRSTFWQPQRPTPDLLEALTPWLQQAEPDQPDLAPLLIRQSAERPEHEFAALLGAGARDRPDLLAMAEVPRSYPHPGWFMVHLWAAPGQQHGSLPAEALERLLQTLPDPPVVLLASATEDRWQADLYPAQGFEEQERMWTSTLDLQTLDPRRLEAQSRRAREAGLTTRPLREVADLNDEDQQRRLYHLMVRLLADVPFSEPIKPWPFEVWRQRILLADDFDPGGLYVLRTAQDEWAGVSELYRPVAGRPGTLHQGLTAVLPEWRGLGAAWLLKLEAARGARARGFHFVQTRNHTGNAAILSINERLGFVRGRAVIRFIRRHGGPAAHGAP